MARAMIRAGDDMKFAKTPIGVGLKKRVAFAALAATMLLMTSCRNDKIGELMKARAAFERKQDSVERIFDRKIDSLEPKTQEESIRFAPLVEKLNEQRKDAAKPFAAIIDSLNKEMTKYGDDGKKIR